MLRNRRSAPSNRGAGLPRARAAASFLVFFLFTAAFVLSGGFSSALAPLLPRLQLFPSLLRFVSELSIGAFGAALGAGAVLAVIFGLSLVFGRLYCAALCPLGALQDGFSALVSLFAGARRGNRIEGQAYRANRGWIQASVFVFAVGAALSGSSLILGIVEPYSAFGKVASGLFRPLVDLFVNLLAALAQTTGSYGVAFVPVSWATARGAAGFLVLATLGTMALSRGRFFCDLLCPAGAILRIVSFRPLVALRVDEAACDACGACEVSCRASCIRPGGGGIEEDRCVRCFDCVAACPTGAISYGTRPRRVAAPLHSAAAVPQSFVTLYPVTRAGFLRLGIGLAAGSGGALLLGAGTRRRKPSLTINGRPRPPAAPPGAGSVERFLAACTACGTCAAVCPSGVIRPAELQWGILDPAKPHLAYDRAYCQFECDLCLRSCPTGALRPLPLEEKKRTRLGKSVLVLDLCVVLTKKTRCGACAEHCPTGAVTMVLPPEGGLPRPIVDEDLCIGCGACETVCPVAGKKAIYVEGRAVQDLAQVLALRPGDAGDGQARAAGREGFPF